MPQTVDESRLEASYPPDSRYGEVEKILSFIKGGSSCQVISLPGVGRSNILRLIAYNRACRELHLKEDQNKFHFVMMHFSEMKGRNLKEATKYIFLEILDSLEDRGMDKEHAEVQTIFDKSLKNDDELVFFQGLKKAVDYLCLERNIHLILLFDRFEDYIPMLTPQFFDNLRALRDRAKLKFSAIFPLSRPLEETLGHEIISSFYEFVTGNIVYLGLGDEKIMDFRKNYLEKTTGRKIDDDVSKEAIILSGGLGKLWLVTLEALLAGESNGQVVEDSRVKAVLNEIWDSLTPHEQKLIKEEEEALESPHLVAVGLIKDNKFSVPLLLEFAKKQPKEKLDLEELSKDLTSSEHKLLKFFMENEDKILNRDEVVNAVWAYLASTSGVTEQALDQLVFRLRRKIEENPNSPIHILTVKGRGFKFVS